VNALIDAMLALAILYALLALEIELTHQIAIVPLTSLKSKDKLIALVI